MSQTETPPPITSNTIMWGILKAVFVIVLIVLLLAAIIWGVNQANRKAEAERAVRDAEVQQRMQREAEINAVQREKDDAVAQEKADEEREHQKDLALQAAIDADLAKNEAAKKAAATKPH